MTISGVAIGDLFICSEFADNSKGQVVAIRKSSSGLICITTTEASFFFSRSSRSIVAMHGRNIVANGVICGENTSEAELVELIGKPDLINEESQPELTPTSLRTLSFIRLNLEAVYEVSEYYKPKSLLYQYRIGQVVIVRGTRWEPVRIKGLGVQDQRVIGSWTRTSGPIVLSCESVESAE